MAKRKYTADEALELIFADNDSVEDFGSSSEDDVSSQNENILEQSDQYCNNSVNLLHKETINVDNFLKIQKCVLYVVKLVTREYFLFLCGSALIHMFAYIYVIGV